jgi:hypothetical protein
MKTDPDHKQTAPDRPAPLHGCSDAVGFSPLRLDECNVQLIANRRRGRQPDTSPVFRQVRHLCSHARPSADRHSPYNRPRAGTRRTTVSPPVGGARFRCRSGRLVRRDRHRLPVTSWRTDGRIHSHVDRGTVSRFPALETTNKAHGQWRVDEAGCVREQGSENLLELGELGRGQ